MKKRVIAVFLIIVTLVSCLGFSLNAYAAEGDSVYKYYENSGSHKVSTYEFKIQGFDYTYKIWYPKDIAKLSKRPIILYCNGTGSNYTMENKTDYFLTVAASHGYVCLSNTDENTGTGASMDAGMTKLIAFNKDRSSRFYKKLNIGKVGIAGHSQGATCTINLSDPAKYKNSKYYKAIYAVSLPSPWIESPSVQNCPYDTKKVRKPTCLIAGTGFTDGAFICPIDKSLKPSFRNIRSDVYMARKIGVEHADSFEQVYPYMIAWFDYQLYGKAFAAKAFSGRNPELKSSEDWMDFKCKIAKKDIAVKKVKAKKKALTVSWGKMPTASGYKVEYSTSKGFKNKKTLTVKGAKNKKATLKNLRSKKYYIRVRAYTTVGRKNYYSKYSKAVSVKVK